jgi:DNA-binding HxlR family transcriptional regulator
LARRTVAEPNSPAAAGSLSELTHHRWALPVLAHVAGHGGCKFVTLSRRLQIPPASLRSALDRLQALELVVRNPGHGHPMRPEYVLGPVGERVDGLPQDLVAWLDKGGFGGELLKKWQLPVLVALGPDTDRFSEVRSRLPGASPRAVALALKSTAALGLVSRDVDGDRFPPVPIYAATSRALPGREPARLLGEILAAG